MRHNQKLLKIGLLAVLCAGCANPTVVEIAPGIYDLSREDHGGIFGNPSALKAGVIHDADAFAKSRGQIAIPIMSKSHPVGVLGDWASFEYEFRLVDTNSPEAHPKSLDTKDLIVNGKGTALRPNKYIQTTYNVITNQ